MNPHITKYDAVEFAQASAENMGISRDKVRPHELLLFSKLDSAQNRYEFSLKHEEARDVLATARGLLDRDAFVAVGMAIGIVPVPILNSVERPTAAAPVYWPDPYIFDEAAAGSGSNYLSEAQALESIFWGTHTLTTNEGNRIDRNPNTYFRTIQETQAASGTSNLQTGMEIKDIGAAVRFGGGDENRIVIDIASSDKTKIGGKSGERQNYLMVRLVGAIIKGSTTKQYLK